MRAFIVGILLVSVLLLGCLTAPKLVYQCGSTQSLTQMETKVTFANTGNAQGAACVNVKLVDRNNVENSQIVCSGQLQPGTTSEKTVSFGLAVLGNKQYAIQCEQQQ